MSALDELRFGADRTLNLRTSLPTAREAVRRTETFLREHQLRGSGEVLVITGRGSHSPDGIAVLRPEVEKLLFAMRRRGVVLSHQAVNPGAFAVQLAPIRSVVEAIPRAKDRRQRPRPYPAVPGLGDATNALLRQLAERSLDELGVRPDARTLEDEMHRHLRALAPGLPGAQETDGALQKALRAALAEYD
jgi:hypothetical protein